MKKQVLIVNFALVSLMAGAQMKVNSTGLIGIGAGSSSPLTQLDISGQTLLRDYNKIVLTMNSLGTNYGHFYTDNTYNNLYLGGSNNITTVPSSPIMTWGLSSYNVGVSVTVPAYKLDVNGDINAAQGSVYRMGGNTILWYNSTATTNIFAGVGAGASIASGTYNSFFGRSAGANNTSGYYNSFVGYLAGGANTTGTYNTFMGLDAGYGNTTGNHNTGIGVQALGQTTSGQYNTGVGEVAGWANTIGNSNTFLGYGANASANNLSNATAIGNGAIVNASNTIQFGNATTGGIFTASTGVFQISDGRFKMNIQENVKGLEFIKKLRPVTYQMDTKKLDDYIIQNMPDSMKIKHQKELDFVSSTNVIRSGFLAQEVEQAAKNCGYKSSIVHAPANNNEPYAMGYQELVVPLVKAVQELSATVDSLQKELKSVKDCCSKGKTQTTYEDGGQGKAPSIHELELANNTVLFQNFPNPFGDGTTIKYFIPDNIQNAQIVFFDEFGNKLNEFKVVDKGMGQLNISSTNLSTGSYSYSLIVNNEVVDTKKMMKVK